VLVPPFHHHIRELLNACAEDSGQKPSRLLVDGGMSRNDLMMQMQADLASVPVDRPQCVETTSLGAAVAAGLAIGVGWTIESLQGTSAKPVEKSFEPAMADEDVRAKVCHWQKAVAAVKLLAED